MNSLLTKNIAIKKIATLSTEQVSKVLIFMTDLESEHNLNSSDMLQSRKMGKNINDYSITK